MRLRSTPAAAIMALALLLGGCVSAGPFPSLAPRPGEGDFVLAEPDRPPTIVADDPALRRQVEALRAGAEDGRRVFETAYEGAQTTIGRAGAVESESWIEAQQALSRLEAARAATAEALARLDALGTARADLPTSQNDFALIEAAIAEVTRMDREQRARIAPLRERLAWR